MERWQQIESLFQEALERDPTERDAWLREACHGDSDLRREVASLLANHQAATNFKPWAAAATAKLIAGPASLEPGQCLGPLLGGWTLTAITTVQTGTPLTFIQGSDVALDGTGGSQHAELAPGVTASNITISHPNRAAFVSRFFNTAAFLQPRFLPAGLYGNAGRGLISGPATSNTDFSALKDFRLHESWKLQFRAEFFNSLNQVNFANPNQTVSAATFGRITSAASGRVIQFALKMLW